MNIGLHLLELIDCFHFGKGVSAPQRSDLRQDAPNRTSPINSAENSARYIGWFALAGNSP